VSAASPAGEVASALGALPDELADKAPGHGRREQRLADGDDPYGVEEPLGGDVFEQEATGSGAQPP